MLDFGIHLRDPARRKMVALVEDPAVHDRVPALRLTCAGGERHPSSPKEKRTKPGLLFSTSQRLRTAVSSNPKAWRRRKPP